MYFRGEALLQANRGAAAAAEFQRVIDNPGLVQNEVIGSLAYLGLARARASSRDLDGARHAYEHFLELWKDADIDLAPFEQAKVEYAALSRPQR